MRTLSAVLLPLGVALMLAGCATDYEASAACARERGCAPGFPRQGYGPIQAQAVAPDDSSRWWPRG